MKIITILFALSLLFVGSGASAQDEVLFVGGAPHDTYQPRVIIPLLEEAFRRNGIRFSAESYPSPRALLMSNSGVADGELHRVHDFHEVSEGRYPNLIRVESQLMSIYLAVFSAKNRAEVASWDDLKGYIVGYRRGRQNTKKHLETVSDETLIKPQNTELGLFRMAAEGRVDYAVSESFAGQHLLQRNPELGGVKEVGKIKEARIYAYMNKKHAELAKKIGATLEDMKKDGTFQKIVESVREEILAE